MRGEGAAVAGSGWGQGEGREVEQRKTTLLAPECSRMMSLEQLEQRGEKQPRAVLIPFAALKGVDGGQGREFWETI